MRVLALVLEELAKGYAWRGIIVDAYVVLLWPPVRVLPFVRFTCEILVRFI